MGKVRITEKQRETMIRLFKGGTDIANLAFSYGINSNTVEDIIREAMFMPEEKP